jgi:hypothetical protein
MWHLSVKADLLDENINNQLAVAPRGREQRQDDAVQSNEISAAQGAILKTTPQPPEQRGSPPKYAVP